jgi:uncharacterized peroxidase-related enzyme
MRLREVERGDGFGNRLLFGFISTVSGMRLPDAARIVMYHKDFYGDAMAAWTQPAMRGESSWSVGERELMAAMTAKWNSCAFCVQAHKGIASLALEKSLVETTLDNYKAANLSDKLKAMLSFLEIAVVQPDKLIVADVQTLLQSGINSQDIEDALAVGTLFSITVRCADTFNFALLNEKDSEKASKRMLTQGYAFKKSKTPGHPDHRAFADKLRERIFEGPGVTSTIIRQKMGKRAAGGPTIEQPFDELALNIGQAADKVTDEQVVNVVKAAGSEKAAFELITAAAVSAGLYRWQVGLKILKEALDN